MRMGRGQAGRRVPLGLRPTDRRRMGAHRGWVRTVLDPPPPAHLQMSSNGTIMDEKRSGCVRMSEDRQLSERNREIEALDAEIASLDQEVWRIAALRAAKIIYRSLLAAADSIPIPAPPEGVEGSYVPPVAGPAPRPSAGGTDERRPRGPSAAMHPAIRQTGVTEIDELMGRVSPGQRIAIPRIWELIVEAGEDGSPSDNLRKIVEEGVVGGAIFAKALSNMAKSGLISFSRSDGRWFRSLSERPQSVPPSHALALSGGNQS